MSTQNPVRLPIANLSFAIALLLAIFICVIRVNTPESWRAGLTLMFTAELLFLASFKTEWGLYVIVAFAGLFIDGWAPTRAPEDVVFRLGIGRIYIMEFAVYSLLVLYLVKRTFGKRLASGSPLFVPTPLDAPLKVFAVLIPISAVYGLARGNAFRDAVGYFEWRSLLLAIVFYFLVTTIIQTPEKALQLFKWFFGMAVLKAAYFLIVYLSQAKYPLPHVFGAGPVDEGPENLIFLFAVLPAISYLSFQFKKDRNTPIVAVVAVIVLYVNLLLSAKRAIQSGFVIGLLFLFWSLPRGQRLKLAARPAAVLLAVTLFFIAFGSKRASGGIERSGARYKEVFAAFQNPQEVLPQKDRGATQKESPSAASQNRKKVRTTGDTLAFHLLDVWDAWNVIRQRPLLGYGFGSKYHRQLTLLPGVGGQGAGLDPGIMHDQYLHIWWKMGLVGLGVYLWLLFRIFQLGFRAADRLPSTASHAIALGLYSALLGDAGIQVWGADWFSITTASLTIFMSLALIFSVVEAKGRTNDFAPAALVPEGVASAS
jgi:hypothetical protein